MNMENLVPPESIARLVRGKPYEQITVGYSNALIFRILGSERNLYLKYMPAGKFTSIRHEAEVTKWLDGRLPVAEIIDYAENESGEYMLMTEIEGESAADVSGMEPEELVGLYAKGLRMIHSVSIKNCPFDQCTAVKIRNCLHNCDHGLVKTEYLAESRRGMSVDQLRELLLLKKLPIDNLVFTHGDYCFPNVIISNGLIAGFIDFSIGGVADRYQDIAIGGRSTEYNMKLKYNMDDYDARQYVELFYREYGLDIIDEEKIELYMLIDDFNR